jgi:hypothetical protein
MGRVSADGFRIVRAIGGRDTFNPVMYGKILLSDNGACIKVIMTFHPLVWLLMLALTAFSGSILFAYFQNPVNIDSTTLPCPFLVVAFPWIIGVLIFFYDSVKSKALFLHVLGLSEADVRK